jgi:hypothetical protein
MTNGIKRQTRRRIIAQASRIDRTRLPGHSRHLVSIAQLT